MDRLRKLYDGRMAVVSVVHSEGATATLKRRLPLLVTAAAVLVIAAAGMSLGFTPYGAFGLKKLFLPQISSGSPQFSKLQEAKRALLVDTLQGYREARDRCAEVLKVKEYPEARAVWAQAIFYLQRRYAAATAQETAKATTELESIRLLGAKHPEVIKAKAGSLLALLRADPILPILQEAVARPQNANDLEMQLLLAESFAVKNQGRQAIEVLNRVVAKDKQCAKAFHALGNLHQSLKQPDKAVVAYGKALEADPKHLSSAVELAAVQLLVLKDATAGAEAVERALVEGSERLLGPPELARARALNGVALAAQNKRKEAIAQFEMALKADPSSVFAKAGLGAALLAEREYPKSAALYKEVVALDPLNQENWDSYLSALFGARKLEEALAAVTQANSHFSGSARIAYQFGRIEDVLGDRPEAESHYKHAINADPKLVAAQVALARFYLRTQRLPEAKAQLEQALTLAPQAPSVHAAIGEVALAEDDTAKAKAELEKSVSEDARLPEAYLGLAELAYSEGALETALKHVDRALALEPYLRDARMQRGLILWKLGKLDAALKDLKEARAQEPKSSKIARANAAVLLDKGDVPAAETVLLEAVTLEPYNAEGHFYLARARNRRSDHNLAIESMRNALERAPKNPAYHYEMGLIQKDAKNIQAAVDEWKRALELDPDYADALEAIGHSYLDRADYDSAVASFEKALKADPKRSRMEALIGDCYFQSSKWDSALSHYLAGLKADPSLTSVYYKIGRTYTEKGKHGTAIDWYRKAIEAEKSNPMVYYYLGYAYKERHRSKDAIEAFKEYLALKPEADDKKEIEDEIYDLSHEK
jgi:tetratricopeptide (TPR) repeat protein